MKKTSFLFAIACISLALTSAFAQQKASVVGTWKVDVAQSEFSSGPAPKSITVTILKDTPQLLSWRVSGVDGKGQHFSYSWSGPEDGSLHPVIEDGKAGADMQSAKREQDGTLLRHDENSDGSSFDTRSTISPDGNTITESMTAKSKDSKQNKEKYVYHRVSGSMSEQ